MVKRTGLSIRQGLPDYSCWMQAIFLCTDRGWTGKGIEARQIPGIIYRERGLFF